MDQKQACVDLEKATEVIAQLMQKDEVGQHIDRTRQKQARKNLEKATQSIIQLLQNEVEKGVVFARSLTEQVEANKQLKLKIDRLQKQLEEKDSLLTQANLTVAFLRGNHSSLTQTKTNHVTTAAEVHVYLRQPLASSDHQVAPLSPDTRSPLLSSEDRLILEVPVSGIKQEQEDHVDSDDTEVIQAQVTRPNMNREVDQLAHLSSLLAERNAELAKTKAQLAETKAQLAERDAEREAHRERGTQLAERDAQLAERDSRLKSSSHLEDTTRVGFGDIGEIKASIQLLHSRFESRGPSTPDRPIPRHSSTPAPGTGTLQLPPLSLSATFDNSIQILPQHADVTLRALGPEDHARISLQSRGQVGTYGRLLFRAIISEEQYKAWCKTTNWGGSRGKQELPHNVKTFVLSTLKRKFPAMGKSEKKDCINRINEYLRKPRR